MYERPGCNSLMEHHKDPCTWPDLDLHRPSGDVTNISPGATGGADVQATPCTGVKRRDSGKLRR